MRKHNFWYISKYKRPQLFFKSGFLMSKGINLFSFAKFQAILFGLLGIACGFFYSFGGLIIDALVSLDLLSSETMSIPGLSMGSVLAMGALVGMPALFAIIGFLTGFLEAILFNLWVKFFGEIEINFHKR